MRFAVDMGGTFTDLVVESDDGGLQLFKAPTVPSDPVRGVFDVLDRAAAAGGIDRRTLLQRGELFLHGTTRGLNAILTGTTARTALLTTKGHPDILLFREGGRGEAFNWTIEYPEPYVPRALTYEINERMGATGTLVPLDEAATVATIRGLADDGVEAVAVSLLWSTLHPAHELRIGELLEEHLPGVPYTLSHQLNPILREYRRTSSTAIDASLKPTMSSYLSALTEQLESAGFGGRLLMLTSSGGLLDVDAVADAPIHSLNSGPSMAPVAGRHYAAIDADSSTAIVADTGGTSYDISVVRRGAIPRTQETWIGPPYRGHMVGFPSVDVKSIGAGGGSIAWVDSGGLLRVGPESAGADPGPVCYGRGGTRPTVTDACLVMGLLDPEYFLGGAMRLDVDGARRAIAEQIGEPLGMSAIEAAGAIRQLATEHMARAIEDVTIKLGVDPRNAVLVGGGGAAGLNSGAIARRLGCEQLIIPEAGATLSAAGALLSEMRGDFGATLATMTDDFDVAGVNALLDDLRAQCDAFLERSGVAADQATISFFADARYPSQNWELDLPLRVGRFATAEDVERMRSDFHALHEDLFAISDPASPVEVVGWRARVSARVGDGRMHRVAPATDQREPSGRRTVSFPEVGAVEARVVLLDAMPLGERMEGPVIVESPVTTVVVEPGATVERGDSGSLILRPFGDVTAPNGPAMEGATV